MTLEELRAKPISQWIIWLLRIEILDIYSYYPAKTCLARRQINKPSHHGGVDNCSDQFNTNVKKKQKPQVLIYSIQSLHICLFRCTEAERKGAKGNWESTKIKAYV